MPLRQLIVTALFAALIVVGTQFTVPIGPIPITMQVFVVFLAGVVLGSRWGAASVLLYILLGVIGLPVFAGGKAGPQILVSPTGGFLLGFVVCAYLVGLLTEHQNRLTQIKVVLVMLLGLIVTYALGLVGLLLSFKYVLGKAITVSGAFQTAVLPFVVFDAIKAVLAAIIGVRVRSALKAARVL